MPSTSTPQGGRRTLVLGLELVDRPRAHLSRPEVLEELAPLVLALVQASFERRVRAPRAVVPRPTRVVTEDRVREADLLKLACRGCAIVTSVGLLVRMVLCLGCAGQLRERWELASKRRTESSATVRELDVVLRGRRLAREAQGGVQVRRVLAGEAAPPVRVSWRARCSSVCPARGECPLWTRAPVDSCKRRDVQRGRRVLVSLHRSLLMTSTRPHATPEQPRPGRAQCARALKCIRGCRVTTQGSGVRQRHCARVSHQLTPRHLGHQAATTSSSQLARRDSGCQPSDSQSSSVQAQVSVQPVRAHLLWTVACSLRHTPRGSSSCCSRPRIRKESRRRARLAQRRTAREDS